MFNTHDVGPIFVHGIRLDRNAPRLHTYPTYEIEAPYRRSNTLIVRLWGERGFALGWWRHTGWDERTALLRALQGYEDTPLDSDGHLLERYECLDEV